MVRSGVRVVGVDFPVTERSLETRLIRTGKIPIVENLRGLASLPRVGFRFSALPLEQSTSLLYAVHAFAEIAK
jgi:kynurenine formamidase